MTELIFTKSQKALGYRIFELRKKIINTETGNSISQDELGLRTGLTKKTIGELERGNTNPEFKTILIICKELNVTLKEFFDFDIDEYFKLSQLKRS